MALSALKPCVVLLEQGDLPGEAADTHVDDPEVRVLRVLVPERVGFRPGERLDQSVPHDSRFRGMGVMAVEAVETVLEVPYQLDRLRRPGPLRSLGRIAHVGPFQDLVLRLALQADGVGSSGRLRYERFLISGTRLPVRQDVPRFAFFDQVRPAVLRLEPAAIRTVDHEVVRQHIYVAPGQVVFLGKSMSGHQLVPEGVGGPVGQLRFLIRPGR